MLNNKKSFTQNQSSNSAIELSTEELDLVAGGSLTDNLGDGGTNSVNNAINVTIGSTGTKFVPIS
jgi:hypothetical protein